MVSALWQAWRSWKSAPGVAALAAIAFAVGIGSATAVYTVVNGVMLRPLPYAEGERFVTLYGARFSEPGQRSAHAFPDLIEYQQRTRSFDVFGWFRPVDFRMVFAGEPQHLVGVAVTPSLALHLGVRPQLGGWFRDDTSAVISSALWRRLGADPAIVGKTMTLDGRAFTIAGVMPASFRLPVPGPGVETMRSDIWIALDPLGKGQPRGEGAYFSYARRKPGVTLAQAEADVKRAAAEIAALDPATHPSYTALLEDLRASVTTAIKPTLILLIAASALLLLITCADVAGLLLARSIARSRETAIRVALGAAQRQLALHYFLEGLIVAVSGAAAGALLSVALVRLVVAMASDHIPRADEIATDWRVLLFAIGAAALASALASLAPFWQATRTVPADVLNEGVRATAGTRTRRVSEALVVGEIALAFTLLAVSAILIAHLRGLTHIGAGFNVDDLLTFELAAADAPSATADARAASRDRLIGALEAIPGVTGAAFANQLPLDGCCLGTVLYAEGSAPTLESVERVAFMNVSPGYWRTLQIPLRAGRFLDERDVRSEHGVVVINQAAAAKYWPGRNPVGAYARLGAPDGSRFQVVGVVGDIRNDGLAKPTVPEVSLTNAEIPVTPMRFLVRSPLPPETLVPAVRRAIQGVDREQPVHAVQSMKGIIEGSLSLERVSSFMLAFFAIAALLMATLGIYGVVSYAVRRGTVEIGTRMALGAIGRDVLVMIVGRGLMMTAYGTIAGGVAAIAASMILVRAFEIRPGVLPFILAAAIVGVVASAASFFPGWRATRLSPMVAIRNEPGSMWQSARQTLRETLTGLSRSVSSAREAGVADEDDSLSDMVSAARSSDSFREAFRLALTTLCGKVAATSGFLLENRAGEYVCIASVPPEPQSACSLAAGGFLLNRLAYYSHPLPMRPADFDAWIRWARVQRPSCVAEIEQLKTLGVRIAVPLRGKSEIVGVLILGEREGRTTMYSEADERLLRRCAGQLTLMIENARLTARVVEQEKLRRDLALAAEVQRRLLPDRAPEATIANLAAISLPARSVGGDYYDFIELGDQRLGIALADIAGKGVAAALIMAVVQATLRIVADGKTSLPELAARMNDFLHRSTRANSYATFFYAQLDQRSRQLRYVNAGHNPPYLIRAAVRPGGHDLGANDGGAPEVQELTTGGTVLGLFPGMEYQEGTVELRSGDVLVAFTDGVTEALDVAEEEFGEARLKDVLQGLVHLPAAEISARLSDELRTWIKDTTQYDDLTFVVMKVSETAPFPPV